MIDLEKYRIKQVNIDRDKDGIYTWYYPQVFVTKTKMTGFFKRVTTDVSEWYTFVRIKINDRIEIYDENEQKYGKKPCVPIAFKDLKSANDWLIEYLSPKYNAFADDIIKAGSAVLSNNREIIVHEPDFSKLNNGA